jgi:hypothetical protein
MTFRIHYTSLVWFLPRLSGRLMRRKQGAPILHSDDVLNNLTTPEDYAARAIGRSALLWAAAISSPTRAALARARAQALVGED